MFLREKILILEFIVDSRALVRFSIRCISSGVKLIKLSLFSTSTLDSRYDIPRDIIELLRLTHLVT